MASAYLGTMPKAALVIAFVPVLIFAPLAFLGLHAR